MIAFDKDLAVAAFIFIAVTVSGLLYGHLRYLDGRQSVCNDHKVSQPVVEPAPDKSLDSLRARPIHEMTRAERQDYMEAMQRAEQDKPLAAAPVRETPEAEQIAPPGPTQFGWKEEGMNSATGTTRMEFTGNVGPYRSEIRLNGGAPLCGLTANDKAFLGKHHTWKECSERLMGEMFRVRK